MIRYLFGLCLIAYSVSASTIHVSLDGDGSDGLSFATAFTNIQDGVDSATDGDIVLVNAGEYIGTNSSATVVVTKSNITIKSNKKLMATIDAGASIRCFDVASVTNVTITGFRMTGIGSFLHVGGEGGAVLVSSNASLELVDCIMNKTRGSFGTVAAMTGGVITLINCVIVGNNSNNGSYGGGGITSHSSTIYSYGCIVEANTGYYNFQVANWSTVKLANTIYGEIRNSVGDSLGGNWASNTTYTIPGAGYYTPTVGFGTNAVFGNYRLLNSATNTRNQGVITNEMQDASEYIAYDINGLPRIWPYGSTTVDIGPHSMTALDHQTTHRRRRR